MPIILLISFAGFIAQLIDGSVGMGFGVVTTSVLLLLAFSPAVASAVVHLAEVVTSFASGASHIKLGNVDWRAFILIALPGGFGAFIGAVLLSNLDLSTARPWTALILIVLGCLILIKFTRVEKTSTRKVLKSLWLGPLGFFGGFIDSTGGGGWGPIVTTSLTVSNTLRPRMAIGTSNTAEFVIAVFASVGFLVGLGASEIPWSSVLALVIGGALAAPFAAWLVSKAPQRILGVMVGNLVIGLNLYQITAYFDVEGFVIVMLFTLFVFLSASTSWIAFTNHRLEDK